MKIMQKSAPAFVAGAAVLWGILIIFVRQLDEVGLSVSFFLVTAIFTVSENGQFVRKNE